MFENIRKVLYIGSSSNIKFMNDFQNIKEFVIIDNKLTNSINNDLYNIIIELYYNNGFELLYTEKIDTDYIFNFNKIFNYIFKYFYIPQSLLIFINIKTSQQIRYYISTNILNNLNNMIKMEVSMSDIIIVNDEIPNIKILQFFDKPKIFIGYLNSLYIFNENYENYENIYDFMFKNNNDIISKYFNIFYLYDENYNKLIKCSNFKDFINKKYQL